ncbi:MAG: sigma-54 dependent transcriptional regulator [Pseudomonadota bacterium]
MSNETPGRILVVDDEEVALKAMRRILEKDGHQVSTYQNPVRALERLEQEEFDLLLADLMMPPYIDGLELMAAAKRIWPRLEVVLITGYASLPNAVEAMKRGAFNYLAKPVDPAELRRLVEQALAQHRLRQAATCAASATGAAGAMAGPERAPFIIGRSAGIRRVQEVIAQVAGTECNVLVLGESGTGKELVAKALHAQSQRRSGPFVAFNCGSFSEELIANELFGHEKGAYTGAHALKRGLLEEASGGTLFLDEIGEMPPAMQVKLLRVLQEREMLRVGGTEPIPLDLRVVAATAADLKAAVGAGAFRQDLYYRLNVVTIELPRLAQRGEDIGLLASTSWPGPAGAWTAGCGASAPRPWRCSRATPSPATCASWRTSWSGPWPWPGARSSPRPTCPRTWCGST